jgi:Zn-dependent peptidase ImmA (M78 family)
VTLRRGFLAEAERKAEQIRKDLDLSPASAIAIEDVARLLNVQVVPADELIDIDRLHELERIQTFAFSACTFDIADKKVIVYNPLRTRDRTQSDIAHELSHMMLDHQLSEIRVVAGVPFRSCQPDQEEEATSLGGTLLLPRPLLLNAVRRGLDETEIAHYYGVTVEMARYRLNKTGVVRQVRSASGVRARN